MCELFWVYFGEKTATFLTWHVSELFSCPVLDVMKCYRLLFLKWCRYVPYVGMATIIMNNYPYVKYLLLGILGLYAMRSKD